MVLTFVASAGYPSSVLPVIYNNFIQIFPSRIIL